jgi:hypothetical protein
MGDDPLDGCGAHLGSADEQGVTNVEGNLGDGLEVEAPHRFEGTANKTADQVGNRQDSEVDAPVVEGSQHIVEIGRVHNLAGEALALGIGASSLFGKGSWSPERTDTHALPGDSKRKPGGSLTLLLH